MADDQDFLDEVIAQRGEHEPAFSQLVDAALHRRELLRALAHRREQLGLSQTTVAARMGTSQSSVARLEAGEADARLSTIERFAAAVGHTVEWRLGRPAKRAS